MTTANYLMKRINFAHFSMAHMDTSNSYSRVQYFFSVIVSLWPIMATTRDVSPLPYIRIVKPTPSSVSTYSLAASWKLNSPILILEGIMVADFWVSRCVLWSTFYRYCGRWVSKVASQSIRNLAQRFCRSLTIQVLPIVLSVFWGGWMWIGVWLPFNPTCTHPTTGWPPTSLGTSQGISIYLSRWVILPWPSLLWCIVIWSK